MRDGLGHRAFAEAWAAGRVAAAEDLRTVVAMAYGAEDAAERAVAAPALAIRALGRAEVRSQGVPLRPADWTYALPKELLFYLLLEGPRTKEQIGAELWPEASTEQLRGRFRTALYQLRKAIGGTRWVRFESGRYAFDRSGDYSFDVDDFQRALADGRSASDAAARATALEKALDLYDGDLLEAESFGRWVEPHRNRLLESFGAAACELARIYEERHAHDAAEECYRRAILRRPLHEAAWRGLARVIAARGDRTRALAEIERFATLLRGELDVEVSAETAALQARLEAHHPDH